MLKYPGLAGFGLLALLTGAVEEVVCLKEEMFRRCEA